MGVPAVRRASPPGHASLGKQTLCQLSYSRSGDSHSSIGLSRVNVEARVRTPLREPLRVVPHEPDRRGDGRSWTAVVDLQVDPPQPGQCPRQAQDSPHIGQPPAIDGLVVVSVSHRYAATDSHTCLRPTEALAKGVASTG